MSLLLVTLSLLALVSCNMDDDSTPDLEGGWNPVTCTRGNSSSCGVDWYITLKNIGLPANVEIVLNDVSVINECDPKAYWSMSSTSSVTEFKINDYNNLDGTQKVSLRIFDLKDCFSSKTERAYEADQTYSVESSGGEKRIVIIRN